MMITGSSNNHQAITIDSLQDSCSQIRNVVQTTNILSPNASCSSTKEFIQQVENIQRHWTLARSIAQEIIGKNERQIKEFPLISWENILLLFGGGEQLSNISKVRYTVQTIESELQVFFSKRVEVLEKEYREKKTRPSQLVKALLLLITTENASETRSNYSKAYALLTEILFSGGVCEEAVVYYKKISPEKIEPSLYLQYIAALIETKCYQNARSIIEELQSLKFVQKDMELLEKLTLLKADSYLVEGNYADAETVLKLALRTLPQDNNKLQQEMRKKMVMLSIVQDTDLQGDYYLSDAKNKFFQLPHIAKQVFQENSLLFELEFWIFVQTYLYSDEASKKIVHTKICSLCNAKKLDALRVLDFFSQKLEECEQGIEKVLTEFNDFASYDATTDSKEHPTVQKFIESKAAQLHEQLFKNGKEPSFSHKVEMLLETVRIFFESTLYKENEEKIQNMFITTVARLRTLFEKLKTRSDQVGLSINLSKYFPEAIRFQHHSALQYNSSQYQKFLLHTSSK